ncbi:type I-E CRISPR-associated protein Cas7/Cse4/CasC [candidate division WOR-3 bacterium]|nr:type I-E CRISPR-associated protein Cas7/Cse4/CasC [candidate division WOR-3 bacterium]
MNQQNNPFCCQRIEFHILQSFPITCLNRDDVGAPKTAVVGGTQRARVSSQCWKRQVRLALHEMGLPQGTRTKLIANLIAAGCKEQRATEEQAEKCGQKIERIFIKKPETKGKNKKAVAEEETEPEASLEQTDTLLFLSPTEVRKIVNAFKDKGFDPDKIITQKDAKKQAKELADLIGKTKLDYETDGIDIALFGRMVAQAATMNVEAASSFAHAISTHRVSNEVEFFTALDDNKEEQGSAHMGSLEFNSATYYRYVSLDLGQLWTNLAGSNMIKAVEAFTKALFIAIPAARQTTMSGASPWDFARIIVRTGQRLQVPFEKAVRTENGSILEPSIAALTTYLDKQKQLWGSMFGELGMIEYGGDNGIDDVVFYLKKIIAKAS